MKITIINGPNLNLLGKREVDIYGTQTFESYFENLKSSFPIIDLEYYQSNIEGEIIDKIHAVGFSNDGIIFNGGALTHTSLAIYDAINAVATPVVEVHISNIHGREDFREKSITGRACKGIISGLGLHGYHLALQYFTKDS